MNLTDHDKEILQAVIDGKKIEYSIWSGEWIGSRYDRVLELIRGGQGHRTRIKPETIMIGDMEVPKPFHGELSDGATYYTVQIDGHKDIIVKERVNNSSETLAGHVKMGIAHLSEYDAIQHAKALIKISGG